jgi:ferredoxin-like protein FixX
MIFLLNENFFDLPVYNVNYENLVCLMTDNSEHRNLETECWKTCPWVCYHMLQKIAILIDQKGTEGATPEEVEAHTQVENALQMFSP